MWTGLNKKIYLFLIMIFIIGIIMGIIFLIYLDESSKEIIFLNINNWLQDLKNLHINSIIPHIILLSTLLILSMFLIGIPLVLFFVFYNGFSIGFMLVSLINIFGIKGLLYGIIYIIISKGFYLFFLGLFIITILKIFFIILHKIFKTKRLNKNNLVFLFKKILLCIAFIFVSDIILYFGGTKLITFFNFLLN